MIRELSLKNYETYFFLGNNDGEKAQKRCVIINVSIRFSGPLRACHSDSLNHTICYFSLSEFIGKALSGAKFNLIECAAQFLYDALSDYCRGMGAHGIRVQKRVEIIKRFPLKDSNSEASFLCSDW